MVRVPCLCRAVSVQYPCLCRAVSVLVAIRGLFQRFELGFCEVFLRVGPYKGGEGYGVAKTSDGGLGDGPCADGVRAEDETGDGGEEVNVELPRLLGKVQGG
ncbi:hypothetical protein RHMOL_Rhmol04G0368700 [Rhododendron molle]|uniref:Uncharacterized protein n=1 Tax=Rhododendron molle TaxID=49168 RepID=A0ACC0PAQ3_RHOML|nr:hypothetical protein RHMOL_Rhmol04G0368700 [Rhododendron molle]